MDEHESCALEIAELKAHIETQDAALAEAREIIKLIAKGYADDQFGPQARKWLTAHPAPAKEP